MGMSRRKFSKEVKLAALQRLESGATVAEVARAFEVSPNLVHRWRKEFRHGPGNAFPGEGKRRWDETKVAHWSARSGSKHWRSIFGRGACSASRKHFAKQTQPVARKPAAAAGVAWKAAIYQHIQNKIEKGAPMTASGMCELVPRITAELKRRGWAVNHKRVGRIMREDNLLCLRRSKFVVTTDSKHKFHIYPNLAGELELTGIAAAHRQD